MPFSLLRHSVFAYLTVISATLFLDCHVVLAQQLPAPAPPRGKAPRPAAKPKPTPAQPAAAPNWELLPDPAVPGERGTPAEAAPTPLPEVTATPRPAPTARPKPQRTPAPPSRASVGGVTIRGLSEMAAYTKLRRALAPKLSAKVVLWDGEKEYSLSRSELGAKIRYGKLIQQARRINGDVPVRFEVDSAQTQSAIARLAAQINRTARPATLDVSTGQALSQGSDGVTLAVIGSAQRIQQALTAQPPRSRVDLVVARVKPSTPVSVKPSTPSTGVGQYRYLLASFSTPYDSRIRGRTKNLRIAAENVNATIVPAGATFSTNAAIGPRNASAGWREAQMFVSGQVVSGVGAGICQCATTLYNAALLAGLPIVERHPHMFRVTYAPPSRDATLYWKSKDFRFRNTTGGPMYVQTFLSGGRFHARLYGTVPPVPQKIQVESRTISRRNGTTSEAYRIVETANGPVRERLSRDHYKPHP